MNERLPLHESNNNWKQGEGEEDSLPQQQQQQQTTEHTSAPPPASLSGLVVCGTLLLATLIAHLIWKRQSSTAVMDIREARKRRLEKQASPVQVAPPPSLPGGGVPPDAEPAPPQEQTAPKKDPVASSPSPTLSQDTKEQTTLDTRNNMPPPSSSLKQPPPSAAARKTPPPKRKKVLSAVSQLCQALSHVIGTPVEAVDDAVQKPLQGGNNGQTIRLFLASNVSADDLPVRFATILEKEPHLLVPAASTIAWLLQRHDRLVVSYRSPSQHAGVRDCLTLLQGRLWQHLAQALGAEVAAAVSSIHPEDDDDDLPDLFSDEVDDVNRSPNVGLYTQEWLAQWEAMNPSLTPTLLEGILSQANSHTMAETWVVFWMDEIRRRLSTAYQTATEEVSSTTFLLTRRWNGLLHLWQQSVLLRQVYGRQLTQAAASTATGHELELAVPWAEVCRGAAYCLPSPQLTEGPASLFGKMLLQAIAPQEPDQVGRLVFSQQAGRTTMQLFDNSRNLLQTARMVGQSFWRLLIKTVEDKQVVFAWFRQVVQKNESLTGMLQADLLSSDGMAQLSSSWRFLCGMSSTIVSLCSDSMQKRLDKKGAQAFDSRYLTYHKLADDQGRLVSPRDSATGNDNKEEIQFDGATEFFFLTAALLHVSLYPMLRVEHAFHQQYNKLLVVLQDMERKKSSVPPHMRENSQTAVVAWLAWDCFLDDPEFLAKMTPFALSQLRWIQVIASQTDRKAANDALSAIPDWFCKEPARWLAHVARKKSSSLAAYQADQAVALTTQLLTVGSSGNLKTFAFSPLVLTELIRVASAFVDAGVRRAKLKQQKRQRRAAGGGNVEEIDDDDDEEDGLDLYSSFDQNDLGVAVFANEQVCVELCPTLLKTFRALDHIEGLNVDAEASFDKFSVKVEIARLLIRLWRHPNGKCRQSIVDLPAEEICKFASSVAAAIGYLLDDACQRYSDVVKLSRQVALSRQDQAFQEKQLRGAVSGFLCGRTLLLLLFRLSAVDEIAKAIGSGSSASDMASMLVHFLDILAHSDGGTHTDMDARQGDRTILLWQRSSAMTPADKTKLAASVVSARNHARQGTGLDVSEVCHLLLALASRWFAKSQQNGKSALVSELVSRDDCDIVKYRNIADRLIPDESSANENPGVAVFRHDGYVHSTLFPKDENAGQVSEAQRGHMRSAKKCHLTHGEISALARRDDVDKFLNSLEAEMKRTEQSESVQMKSTSETLDIIMSAESSSDEAKYGLVLSPWVVSSEEFSAGDNSSRFLHYFDKTARDRGAMGSGKTLVLEARKCHKGIPRPHPNSAVFVCFAEERMDLCRAVVTGPVDTPYAHGIFTFDVYFPPSFPRIPPLVQFMTTGGGQVRFGPNLYQDGKVCLSLLGTFHAQDESQQWNPRISSLAQILLSIQTQLLTKDPYFLEPGHEAMMHNATGRDASMRYNMKRRLDTLRHAILEPLIEAPLGSEEVVQRHFAFCRRRIAVQARRWTVEAQGTSLAGRFEKVYGQILSRLSSLSTGLLEEISPLEATSEDIQFLSARDSTFLKYNADTDRKPAAVPARYAGDTPSTSFAANPWATDSSGGAVQGHTSTAGKTDTSDDEDDFYS